MFQDRIFIGIGGSVLALRTVDGSEIWRHELKGMLHGMLTGVALVGQRVYATQNGELTCLDPVTGAVLWHNKLPGLGTQFISITGGSDDAVSAHQSMQAAQMTSAAAAATVIATTTATRS
jgi:outer membrane protein assembly factor BamB